MLVNLYLLMKLFIWICKAVIWTFIAMLVALGCIVFSLVIITILIVMLIQWLRARYYQRKLQKFDSGLI